MYADPKLIKKHILKVCLDDYTSDRIEDIVKQTGEQRQVILRRLVLASLKRLDETQSALVDE
jgi:hypothetical protein